MAMHFQSPLLAWSIVVPLYEMLTTGWMCLDESRVSWWLNYHVWYYQFEVVSSLITIGYIVANSQNHTGLQVAVTPFKIILVLVGPVAAGATG